MNRHWREDLLSSLRRPEIINGRLCERNTSRRTKAPLVAVAVAGGRRRRRRRRSPSQIQIDFFPLAAGAQQLTERAHSSWPSPLVALSCWLRPTDCWRRTNDPSARLANYISPALLCSVLLRTAPPPPPMTDLMYHWRALGADAAALIFGAAAAGEPVRRTSNIHLLRRPHTSSSEPKFATLADRIIMYHGGRRAEARTQRRRIRCFGQPTHTCLA